VLLSCISQSEFLVLAHNILRMIISEKKKIPAVIHLHYHFPENVVKSQDVFGLHSSGNLSIQVSTATAATPCLSEVKNIKGVSGVGEASVVWLQSSKLCLHFCLALYSSFHLVKFSIRSTYRSLTCLALQSKSGHFTKDWKLRKKWRRIQLRKRFT
jgi:hypothetical protein